MKHNMKLFQTLLPAALALTIGVTACSENASTTETTVSADSTVAAETSAADTDQQKLEANKSLVKEFYQALYGDKDSTAIDKYVADDIKQHNPLLQDGKAWLKTALEPFLSNPNIEKTKIDFKQVAAEGDMVWILVKDTAPNGKVFARVDIFRVANGKIVENWKVSELVPEKSANNNSPF
jgi:predicted SnoaL-like aldol condensation-catalyzing enzyme